MSLRLRSVLFLFPLLSSIALFPSCSRDAALPQPETPPGATGEVPQQSAVEPAQGAVATDGGAVGAAAAGANAPDAAQAAGTPQTAAVQQEAGAIFAAVRTGDVTTVGEAPQRLAKLGAAALPVVTQQLAGGELPQRRVAALTLLQLGRDAAPAIAALRAAANDADPAVRAAAEHALKRATGDTSDLDRLRAQHEAAVRGDR